MILDKWNELKISDICTLKNGHSFKPSQWDVKGLPIIRIQNLNGSDNFNYYSGDVNEAWLVETGQLLFSWAGTKGVSFGPFIWSHQVGVLNQHIYKVNEAEGISKEWLYEALRWVTNKIEAQAHGFKATLLHVQKKDIDNQIVLVPPLPEQRKIAKILSAWDKAIATTEKLIATSKQQKKALMQQLLTGKKRLVNPKTGRVFEGEWEETSVGRLIDKHIEKSTSSGQYPVLTSSRKGIFFQSEYYNGRDIASEDNTGYNVVPRGFFTYRHMSDDLVFRFNINTICDRGIVSTLYPVFAANEVLALPYFLQCTLNEGSAFKRFSLSQKQGGSRTYMYLSKLNELQVKMPSLIEQQKIVQVLIAADKEIEHLESKLAHFQQEKKALMQQLLTGKRRVKVEEVALS